MMGVTSYYNYIMKETVDPRTKDWFLVNSPLPMALILIIYYYFISYWGPNYMKDREAYSLKTFIKGYNIFQIISNSALVYGTAISGWLTSYSLGCEPLNSSTTGEGYRMAATMWWTYMVKIIDLSETVIYVLRKKDRQISGLHVYHHISTVFVTWMCVKWSPGGMLSSGMLINCGVHVIMYTYYLMSAGGPALRKIVQPIKHWITIIQMAQFCVLVAHISQGLSPSCNVPTTVHAILIADLMINFCLFYNFYTKNYTRKKID